MSTNIIDWKNTLKLCNNNESLAIELITMLQTDLPRQKQILLHAYDKNDIQMMRDIVHQILGSCSYLSLPIIENAARKMHQALHSESAELIPSKTTLIEAMNTAISHPFKKPL